MSTFCRIIWVVFCLFNIWSDIHHIFVKQEKSGVRLKLPATVGFGLEQSLVYVIVTFALVKYLWKKMLVKFSHDLYWHIMQGGRDHRGRERLGLQGKTLQAPRLHRRDRPGHQIRRRYVTTLVAAPWIHTHTHTTWMHTTKSGHFLLAGQCLRFRVGVKPCSI